MAAKIDSVAAHNSAEQVGREESPLAGDLTLVFGVAVSFILILVFGLRQAIPHLKRYLKESFRFRSILNPKTKPSAKHANPNASVAPKVILRWGRILMIRQGVPLPSDWPLQR